MHIYAAKMHFSRCTHYTHVYVLMRTNKDILVHTYNYYYYNNCTVKICYTLQIKATEDYGRMHAQCVKDNTPT